MIVKVGDQKVNSSKFPVIVEFDDEELEIIKTLNSDKNVIYSYPLTADEKEVEEWAYRRINEEDDEEDDNEKNNEGNI